MDPSQHPWWHHLPKSRRQGRQLELLWLRCCNQLARRSNQMRLALLIYLGLCLLPLLIGQPHLSLMALLPVLLVPPVGYLAYLLAWHEFHR